MQSRELSMLLLVGGGCIYATGLCALKRHSHSTFHTVIALLCTAVLFLLAIYPLSQA